MRGIAGSLTVRTVSFCRALHQEGVRVGPGDSILALRALETIGLSDPRDCYLALRAVLVRRREEEPVFDRLFGAYFGAALPRETDLAGDGQEGDQGVPGTDTGEEQLQIEDWGKAEDEEVPETQAAAYSPAEQLAQRDFASLGGEDLARVERLVARIGRRLATRKSRRFQPSRRHLGRLDLRRVMREGLATGGETVHLRWRGRKVTRHRIVVLLDVSRSMEPYTRFLVLLLFALQSRLRGVETFVFSTRLSRVTPWLKKVGFRHAALGLAALAVDWSGGTRIGESLGQFVHHHGARLLGQRSVVIILSDGWDMGDPELVQRAMGAMKRRAQHIIWLNPLLGSPGYRPETRGMKAALPYIDLFAPAHNLESLRELERVLGRQFF